MTAFQLIRTHLMADSSVTALATGGIWAVRGKQSAAGPQIIGRQTDGNDEEGIEGTLLPAITTLDIGCVAGTYDAAVALYDAVRASLRTMRKTTVSGKRIEQATIANVRELDYPDENLSLFAVMFTLTFRYK